MGPSGFATPLEPHATGSSFRAVAHLARACLRAGDLPPTIPAATGLSVATHTLWVTASGRRAETSRLPSLGSVAVSHRASPPMFPDRIDHRVRPRWRKPVKYASSLSRRRSNHEGLAPPAGTNLCSVTRVHPEIAPESHAHSPAPSVLSKNLPQHTPAPPSVKGSNHINNTFTTCCEYMVNNSRTPCPLATSVVQSAVDIPRRADGGEKKSPAGCRTASDSLLEITGPPVP